MIIEELQKLEHENGAKSHTHGKDNAFKGFPVHVGIRRIAREAVHHVREKVEQSHLKHWNKMPAGDDLAVQTVITKEGQEWNKMICHHVKAELPSEVISPGILV